MVSGGEDEYARGGGSCDVSEMREMKQVMIQKRASKSLWKS